MKKKNGNENVEGNDIKLMSGGTKLKSIQSGLDMDVSASDRRCVPVHASLAPPLPPPPPPPPPPVP